jgi:hypothetical protein
VREWADTDTTKGARGDGRGEEMASVPSLPGLSRPQDQHLLPHGAGGGLVRGEGGAGQGVNENEQVVLQVQVGESLSRALETMKVERAKELLKQLEESVSLKEQELQTMVAERYPELIESADAIVSMKASAASISEKLGLLPSLCEDLIAEGKRLADGTSSTASNSTEKEHQSHIESSDDAVRLMLNAPSTMWSHIDEKNLLSAARLFLRCEYVMNGLSSSRSSIPLASLRFLKSQWNYMRQFPNLILSSCTNELGTLKRNSGASVAALLAAAIVVSPLDAAPQVQMPLQSAALLLLLKERGCILAKIMRTAAVDDSESLAESLTDAVWIVHRTLKDVSSAFCGDSSVSVHLKSCSDGIGEDTRAMQVPGPACLRSMCTDWLAAILPRIRLRARTLMGSICDATALARMRQVLWEQTRSESSEGEWVRAWNNLIDVGQLRRKVGVPVDGPDMWNLLFSTSFAGLADQMLRHSLTKVTSDILGTLDEVMVEAMQVAPQPLAPHDALRLASRVVKGLCSSLHSLRNDAESLVQPGDEQASAAMKYSLRVQCATLSALLVCRLRFLGKSLRQRQQQKGPQNQESNDAALVIWRLATLLEGPGGDELREFMDSSSSARSSFAGVEMGQIEAAFEIADTDGDGELGASELGEAFQAIGGSIPDVVLPSVTLPEFVLLASGLLREVAARDLLASCLAYVSKLSASVWEEWTFSITSEGLKTACALMDASVRIKGITNDTSWRKRYGAWDEVQVAADDADASPEFSSAEDKIFVPQSVSTPLICYLEAISRALGLLLSTYDFVPSEAGDLSPFQYARALARARIEADVIAFYKPFCETAIKFAPEATRLQCAVDLAFLVHLMPCSQPICALLSSMEDAFDPIDLQTFQPHIDHAAKAALQGHHVHLSRIFAGMKKTGPSMSNMLSGLHLSESFGPSLLKLSTKVPRFELLPLALSTNSAPTKAEANGTRAPPRASDPPRAGEQQTAMLQAANQALAGFVQGSGLFQTASSLWGGGGSRATPNSP